MLLDNISINFNNKIKVYAFVGPSGTGKSYRAQMVAGEYNIHYIIDDGSIKGICALEEQGDELWIKFLEISATIRGQGWGSEFIDCLIEKTNKRIIRLYPKNTELGDSFYKPLGFKWLGNNEMYYLNWGELPNAAK